MSGEPKGSVDQVLELSHVLDQVIKNMRPDPLQEWIGLDKSGREFMTRVMNAGPKTLSRAFAYFEPPLDLVARYKWGLMFDTEEKDMPNCWYPPEVTGWRFSGTRLTTLARTLISLGILPQNNSFPIEDSMWMEISRVKQTVLRPGPTYYCRLLSDKRDAVDRQKANLETTTPVHLASMEELLECVLDIAIKAMLRAKSPTEAIRDWFEIKPRQPVFVQTSTKHGKIRVKNYELGLCFYWDPDFSKLRLNVQEPGNPDLTLRYLFVPEIKET